MKFVHLGDLHIGKRVNGFSMLEDQKYVLEQILKFLENNKQDAVFIAGDIYDTQLPSIEAVRLFDKFLTKLSNLGTNIFIISGNHDSADRLAFAADLLSQSRVYISPVFNGNITATKMKDAYGYINIYMLPFIKPIHVKKIWPEEDIQTYDDAVKTVISKMSINPDERNVIIAHQFVTGAKTSDSEEISVGGIDNVSAENFLSFDYAALGHIHRSQSIGRKTIRYAGAPLKYSFSEYNNDKVITCVEIKAKGTAINISQKKLHPLRDMRKLRGQYMDLTLKSNYEGTRVDDYLAITLTDENEIPDVIGKLRTIYPNIMKIDYDNTRTRTANMVDIDYKTLQKSPIDMLNDFYLLQNNRSFSQQQYDFVESIIEEIWEEE
ncbi:exonuclease SbcCD subunit D [Pectinatus sottacetonis]|uniref:exonuclease SbcCD subunit D n=1 Tax=Pectinatus sottacetonis TaxID=1002795 RepID=UPI0018C80419|nr:exonuclease SbcCD subunit D [Pectinatus sottacetonis]